MRIKPFLAISVFYTMTFEFSVHPSFNFLESFAQKLQVPVGKYSLSIPPALGQGYVRKIDLEADLKFVLHHYTLTEPFHLRRLPSPGNNDLVSIIFNSHEIPLDPSAGKEEAIRFIKAHGAAIQVASSSIGTESFFPPGAEIFFGVIGVTPGALAGLVGIASPNSLLRAILSGGTPFFSHESMFPEAQRVLKQLAVLPEDSPLAALQYRIKVLELLYLLFERLLRRETAPQSAVNIQDLEKLYQIKSAISQDLSIPPRLPELARSVQMSETKMKQLFRQVFGNTIYNYYQQLRLEQAAFLLKQGRYTVSEVGYQLGFSNLSHFGRLFEKHYGLKPKKYVSAGLD